MAVSVPSFDKLMTPLVGAMEALGGSGSIEEIYDKVVEQQKFTDEVISELHDPEKSNLTEIAYRLAWARTYLKKYGLLENSSRGIWSLNHNARRADKLDTQKVVKFVRDLDKSKRSINSKDDAVISDSVAEPSTELGWKEKLHTVLTRDLDPAAFERLVQRVLRESGFTQVEVTGRSGDGGIDGRGIARINGLLSFHVLFQCKRYKGSVSPGEIRDFRGAMQGRADKGLFITTGTFTPAAVKEATRDGAPPIELLDGNELAEKLRELGIGVTTKTVQVYEVDVLWFSNI